MQPVRGFISEIGVAAIFIILSWGRRSRLELRTKVGVWYDQGFGCGDQFQGKINLESSQTKPHSFIRLKRNTRAKYIGTKERNVDIKIIMLRGSLDVRVIVKAVMVYIKVVLKPPSASHNSEAIQEAQE